MKKNAKTIYASCLTVSLPMSLVDLIFLREYTGKMQAFS